MLHATVKRETPFLSSILANPFNHTTNSVAQMAEMKITYFEGPGRAEVQRLLCALGGLKMTDEFITFPAWGEMKKKVSPQQLPIFSVDGVTIGQSTAQQRYLARLAGLYPEDMMEALKVDEIVDYVNIECFGVVDKLFKFTGEEQKAMGAKCVAEGGELYDWFKLIDARLEGREFAVADRLTFADVAIFAVIQQFRAEFYPGMPGDCLDGFRNIMKHANMMATNPKVKEYYANATGPSKVFQP